MDPKENLVKSLKFRFCKNEYEYDDFLGKGGFGSCYSFKSKTSDRIAVKIIDKTKMKLKSIVRESEIHKRLNHENVVRYLSQYENNSYFFIIMEICDKSLQYILHIDDFLPLSQIRKYGQDILKGLCYIHNNDIIHRDIKLENILISSDGVAKISDFGLSRDLTNFEETSSHIFCGSYHYLAPEIITHFRYSSASDIWSFGVIIYRLTIGRYPFFGNFEDLLYRIEHMIYQRCASMNMNKNGQRLTHLFCYIFRPRELRLTASELLSRSFFRKSVVLENDSTEDVSENEIVKDSCVITKDLPTNFNIVLDVILSKLRDYDDLNPEPVDDFVYIVTFLDYTVSYGIMYFLSNNVCGFWHFDQSTLFRYKNIYYHFKYEKGQRFLMDDETHISTTKDKRFKILLNELLSPEGQEAEDDPIMPAPIFIDYWVQTVEFFMIILSNASVLIEKYKNFRGNQCDRYILSGETGILYLKLIQNDELYLRPVGLYERYLFFKENPLIMEILSNIVSKK